jgi:hypothetical protein
MSAVQITTSTGTIIMANKGTNHAITSQKAVGAIQLNISFMTNSYPGVLPCL